MFLLWPLLVFSSLAADGPAAEDLRAVAAFVEAAHPAPWATTTPEGFRTCIETEADGLEEQAGANALRRSLARCLATLGDFHLRIEPGPLTEHSLPLLPRWTEDAILVDSAAVPLPRGTRLLSVNGRPAAALWSELSSLVMVDGEGERRRAMSVELHFPVLLAWVDGPREVHEVVVQPPGETPQALVLEGVAPPALMELVGQRHSALPASDGLPALSRPAPGMAVLRLPSFAIPQRDRFLAALDAALDGVRRREVLVLDLRHNPGGFRHLGVEVLNRVLRKPYQQWAGVSTRVRTIGAPHAQRLRYPFGSAEALGAPFADIPEVEGRSRIDGDPEAAAMTPRGPGHPGPLAVFVDVGTASAAVELVVGLLSQRPDTTIVGEETGGGCDTHAGQFPVVYTTEHLDVSVWMSLYRIEQVPIRGCQPGRGIQPDVVVPRTPADEDPYVQALRLHLMR